MRKPWKRKFQIIHWETFRNREKCEMFAGFARENTRSSKLF